MGSKGCGGNGTGSGSPCGACKFLRRKCASDCIFAPYFCSDQGAARFAAIHKVFGASNVSKLLLHIPARDRYEAVVTISYEAQARIRDPVYGCVSHIFALQHQVACLQAQVMQVKGQLAQKNLMEQQWGGVVGNSNMNMVGAQGPVMNAYNNYMMTNPMSPPQTSLDSIDHTINTEGIQLQDIQSVRSEDMSFPKRRSFINNDFSELHQLALRMMRN